MTRTFLIVFLAALMLSCATTQAPLIETKVAPVVKLQPIVPPEENNDVQQIPTRPAEVVQPQVAQTSEVVAREDQVAAWWPYTIQRGDTTFRLMKRCGTLTKEGEDAFLRKNGIANPNIIMAGAKVLLPCRLELQQVAVAPPEPSAPRPTEEPGSEVEDVYDLFNEEPEEEAIAPPHQEEHGLGRSWSWNTILFLALLLFLLLVFPRRRFRR